MFRKVLIPISSKYLNYHIIHEAIPLLKKFNSHLHILFIIEEDVLESHNEISSYVRTSEDRKDTQEKLEKDIVKQFEEVYLKKVKKLLNEERIDFIIKENVTDSYYDKILDLTKNSDYDLVMLDKKLHLKIEEEFLEKMTTSVWVEIGGDDDENSSNTF